MVLRNVLSPSPGQSTLMEAAYSSETQANTCQTTRIITQKIALPSHNQRSEDWTKFLVVTAVRILSLREATMFIAPADRT